MTACGLSVSKRKSVPVFVLRVDSETTAAEYISALGPSCVLRRNRFISCDVEDPCAQQGHCGGETSHGKVAGW